MAVHITPKQKVLLEFICDFTNEKGYGPSQREIANHFGWKSLGTVQDYLKKLEAKGLLKKEWNARRALEVSPTFSKNYLMPKQMVTVPMLGRITAGEPIEAMETSKEELYIPKQFLPDGDLYALSVEGDSMIEDGIFEGDNIIIRRQTTAENGETVVALIDNNATVKRMYKRNKKIELHPANRNLKPFSVPANRFSIRGIVVGLYRRY